MFDKVGDADFVAGEHDMLRFWRDQAVFDKLRAQNAGKPPWSFLDGPITANNPMGVHHAWGRTYKDAFQRYWAMNGRELRYQNGFDCQGLWVEVEVEKQLGLGAKSAIESYGIDRFVWECKKRVLKYAAVQTEQSIRLGYWMEWDDPQQLRKLSEKMGTGELVEFTPPKKPGERVTDTAERIVERLGNLDWGGSYFTFSTENNETIWTFLKKCFTRGKVYRGHDVMPWSGKAGSAYSQMEVADGRRLTTHRALFVRFPVIGKSGQWAVDGGQPEEAQGQLSLGFKSPTNEYLLIWTTTPWTLTSNVAAMVNPDLDYVQIKAKRDGAVYYFAKENVDFQRLAKEFKEGFGRPEWGWPEGTPKLKTLGQIFKEQGGYETLGVVKGADLIGWQYRGPFDDLSAQTLPGGFPEDAQGQLSLGVSAIQCHRVIDGGRDFKGSPNVVAGEGTGIVHSAPGCGDIDHQIGLANGLVSIAPLNEDGTFMDGFGPFTGKVAVANETVDLVIEELKRKELLVAVEKYPHIYPFCWRTGDELVFRLVDEWFINMDWRDEIMDITRQIDWLPESIQGKERELEWLGNMRDWMISKKRYWGLALPIWVDDTTGDYEVIGSLAELKERALDGGEGWDEFEGHTPHKPWIDKVKLRNPKTGNLMSRVTDVGNPWLDAGIVSFSTLGFNTNPEYWKKWYPANMVTECFPGQFRNWFYSLLSMAAMMDHSPPFKTLLGHRLVMNEQGKPMHKSDGTAIWFEEAAEQLGVDTLRWMYLQQNPAQDLRFGTRHPDQKVAIPTVDGPKDMTIDGVPTCLVTSTPADEVRRQVLLPLWNSYAFFVNYARLDGFDPAAPTVPQQDRPHTDRWILTGLGDTIQKVRTSFEEFDTPSACQAVAKFIDDLSNWYIRRNRKRFWRSRDAGDQDKLAAYQTLYECLLTLSKLMAPMTPFLAERIYQNLKSDADPLSVHLCEFPTDSSFAQRELLEPMALAQDIVTVGHRLREAINQRVRQPLAKLRVGAASALHRTEIASLSELIADELNVKTVTVDESLADIVSYKYRANPASLGKKHGKLLGKLREQIPALPAETLAPLRTGGTITLTIDGQTVELTREDVSEDVSEAEGWKSAAQGDVQLALSTALTPELVREGMARDVVRQIQQMRKDADLEIEQRIRIEYAAADALVRETLTEWSDFIRGETLCNALESAAEAADMKAVTIGDCAVKLRLTVV